MTPLQKSIPFGWYYVAEAATLKAGEIRAVRRFGKDLILWRGSSGDAHLQQAHCPHLGAHIGIGGEVVGDTVQCPFHHWRFDGDGATVSVPYASRQTSRACLQTLSLCERHGNILAWYHPKGAAPSFDPPVVPELLSGNYSGPFSESHLIRTHIQEMVENVVDNAHFACVHGHPGAAEYEAVTFEGPLMIMKSRQVFPSSRGPVDGTLDATNHGCGMAVVHYRTLVEVCMLVVNSPIETNLTETVFQVYYLNPEGNERIDRIGQVFKAEVNRQLMQDAPIWENKIYRARPVLCDGDGPIMPFRHWVEQFYAAA